MSKLLVLHRDVRGCVVVREHGQEEQGDERLFQVATEGGGARIAEEWNETARHAARIRRGDRGGLVAAGTSDLRVVLHPEDFEAMRGIGYGGTYVGA